MARARTTKPAARKAARANARNKKPLAPFPFKLALNQWLLSLFGVERFGQFAEHLRDEKLEGLAENNVHRFHHALVFIKLPHHSMAPAALLG
jgi:hypothetical protein